MKVVKTHFNFVVGITINLIYIKSQRRSHIIFTSSIDWDFPSL